MIVPSRYQPQTIARGIVGAPQISGDGSSIVWNQNVNGQVERTSSDPRQDILAAKVP